MDLLVVILVLTLINFKLSGRWVYYEGEQGNDADLVGAVSVSRRRQATRYAGRYSACHSRHRCYVFSCVHGTLCLDAVQSQSFIEIYTFPPTLLPKQWA